MWCALIVFRIFCFVIVLGKWCFYCFEMSDQKMKFGSYLSNNIVEKTFITFQWFFIMALNMDIMLSFMLIHKQHFGTRICIKYKSISRKFFLFIDNDINVDITKTNLYYAHSVLMDFFYCVSQHSTPTYYTINSFYEFIFIKKKYIFSISLYYNIAFTSQEKEKKQQK